MDTSAIQSFLLVVETGSFTEAGQQLYLTRQAISRKIKGLEEELGFALFVRDNSKLELTYNGELFLSFVQDTIQRWGTYSQQLLLPQKELPHLRISCVNGIDIWRLLNESVQQVRKRFDFDVEITYHSPDVLAEALRTNTADLFVTFHPENESKLPSNYRYQTITPVDMCLVVGRDYPGCDTATSAYDFIQEPVVAWLRKNDTEDSCIRKCLQDFRGMGMQPRKALVYPNMESAHAAIEFCKGVGMCSSYSKLVNSQAVRCFPMKAGADLVCLYDADTLTPISRALLESMASQALG